MKTPSFEGVLVMQLCSDEVTAGKILRLMDALDDIDDVTNTHVNFDIPEALLG